MESNHSLVGVEESAVKIITRAIELEQKSQLQPALTCYQEGINLLLDVLKGCQDNVKKVALRKKLEDYMSRAEKIKADIIRQKDEGTYHTQININENDTGYGYSTVFLPYTGDDVKQIWVEDPYIRSYHQVCNFLRFCELVVAECSNLQVISLKTSMNNNDNKDEQAANLSAIKNDLKNQNIQLNIIFCESLHDRQTRFSNGWIIKIGRGLDYFKRANKFTLGFFDLNQRKCHQTTIDVFHDSQTTFS